MSSSVGAYERLRDEIVSWRLTPGTPLSETEFAERLGVSRTPLRAALARLTLEGLVESVPGKTAVVSAVSAETVRDLFELRYALETHAARLAAQRGDPAVFAELARRFTEAGERIEGRGGADFLFATTRHYEDAVIDSLGNPAYAIPLYNVQLHLGRARLVVRNNPARLRDSAEEHRVMSLAIEARDEDAAVEATRAHLRSALAAIMAALDEDPQQPQG